MALNVKWFPAHANNYGVGRAGKTVNKVIVHWIVGTLESADTTFANPNRKASAHYGIGDGDIHQYVKEEDTAWHASQLETNRESIGIEHEGGWELTGGTGARFKPTEATHRTSAKLIADICKRYNIPIDKEHILPHNRFSNTQCPGTLDMDFIISLAKTESGTIEVPVDEDKQRALAVLEVTRMENSFGNLESASRSGQQSIRDVKTLNDRIKLVEENNQKLAESFNKKSIELQKLAQENEALRKENENLKNNVLPKPVGYLFGYNIYFIRP